MIYWLSDLGKQLPWRGVLGQDNYLVPYNLIFNVYLCWWSPSHYFDHKLLLKVFHCLCSCLPPFIFRLQTQAKLFKNPEVEVKKYKWYKAKSDILMFPPHLLYQTFFLLWGDGEAEGWWVLVVVHRRSGLYPSAQRTGSFFLYHSYNTRSLNNWLEFTSTQPWPEPGWTGRAKHERDCSCVCFCVSLFLRGLCMTDAFTVNHKIKNLKCVYLCPQTLLAGEKSALLFKSSRRVLRIKYLGRRSLDRPVLETPGSHWFLTRQLGHQYNKMHYSQPHIPSDTLPSLTPPTTTINLCWLLCMCALQRTQRKVSVLLYISGIHLSGLLTPQNCWQDSDI